MPLRWWLRRNDGVEPEFSEGHPECCKVRAVRWQEEGAAAAMAAAFALWWLASRHGFTASPFCKVGTRM